MDDDERAQPSDRQLGTMTAAIEQRILVIRGQKVMIDVDLAALYEVETKRLVQAVKRNLDRFPPDFMFQLGRNELADLRSQNVTSRAESTENGGWGGRRSLPFAFTEQGVAMLSSVLRSERAVAVNIEIMRAFVNMRCALASSEAIAEKLGALEQRCDQRFEIVFEAIRQLARPVPATKRTPGFRTDVDGRGAGSNTAAVPTNGVDDRVSGTGR